MSDRSDRWNHLPLPNPNIRGSDGNEADLPSNTFKIQAFKQQSLQICSTHKYNDCQIKSTRSLLQVQYKRVVRAQLLCVQILQVTPKKQNSLFAGSFLFYKLVLSVRTYVWLVLIKTVLFPNTNTSHICFPALFLSTTSVRQHCSVRINTDSFDHWHNNHPGFLVSSAGFKSAQ